MREYKKCIPAVEMETMKIKCFGASQKGEVESDYGKKIIFQKLES